MANFGSVMHVMAAMAVTQLSPTTTKFMTTDGAVSDNAYFNRLTELRGPLKIEHKM